MGPARKKQRLSNGSAAAVDSNDIAGPEIAASTSTTAAAAENETPAQAQEKAVQQRRSLFIRALPASTTSDSLTDLFSDAFPVKHAVAVTDPATKECRGYGFVTFADAEDAARAKEQFHGHVLDGKKLRVEVAEPRNRNATDGADDKKKKTEEEKVLPPTKIIVRNLPWSIKKGEQLSKLFMSYGKVKQAYIPKKGPGLMAGFGFVIMRGNKNAEKAIEGVNGTEVDGRTLAVDWAVDKGVFKGTSKDDQDESLDDKADGDSAEEDLDDIELDGSVSEDDGSDMSGDVDLENGDEDVEDVDSEGPSEHKPDDRSSTLFVRNLPFTCTDEDLEDHFAQFGSTRYARVVMDYETGRSKGTGFVCFYSKEDADNCLRNAPIRTVVHTQEKTYKGKDGKPSQPANSILQNDYSDPSGQYTLDGRVLQITRAVEKSEANRLTEEGTASRYKRDNDKRKLYLLSEGTISHKSKLWEELSPSEQAMREQSAKQRKTLIESNPSLHLSLTRLSVRNLPRSIDSKELKQLAREAVVGFASDVKSGLRQRLSAEETARGAEEMRAAENARKKAGKGIVKQAKVVFESAGGSKVSEGTGAGRSRGYGFIEYYTHRNALMGLRWLNGHAVGYTVQKGKSKLSRDDVQDRKKRLIVEFAIENAQVMVRRRETEQKARARSQAAQQGLPDDVDAEHSKAKGTGEKPGLRKRKRGSDAQPSKTTADRSDKTKAEAKTTADEKLAARNRIIGKKRAMRARKGGKGKS